MSEFTEKQNQQIKRRRPRLMLAFFLNKKSLLVWSIIAIILGIAAIVAAFVIPKVPAILKYVLIGVGALLCLLGILGIVLPILAKPSVEKIDLLYEEDYKSAFNDVFDYLAINNNRADFLLEPIELTCPELHPGSNSILYRYHKKAGKVYYSQTGYTWILFGKDGLFTYHTIINHVYGNVCFEEAHEIGYCDVVDIKTETSFERGMEILKLELTLINGQTICFNLRYSACKENTSNKLNEVEKDLISTIRRTIRDNK